MFNIIILILIILLFPFMLASLSLAPWVPTRKKDLERILKLADLQPGETFYDLGCGNGRAVFYIGKHTKANAIGIEIAYPLYIYCQIKQLFHKNKNIEFKLKNLFKIDLSQADVIYIFGMEDKLKGKLKNKLEQELKKGTRILTYAFEIQGWQAKKINKPTKEDISIYLYII